MWGNGKCVTIKMINHFIKVRPKCYSKELLNEQMLLNALNEEKLPFLYPREMYILNISGYSLGITKSIGSTNVANVLTNTSVSDIVMFTNIIRGSKVSNLPLGFYLQYKYDISNLLYDTGKLHPMFRKKSKQYLLDILHYGFSNPSEERCFVHGDFCPPNIIISESKPLGLVDFGEAHIGDPLYDIATMSWMLRGLLGKNAETEYLNQLKITDMRKLEFYRLIYDILLPKYKTWDWYGKNISS